MDVLSVSAPNKVLISSPIFPKATLSVPTVFSVFLSAGLPMPKHVKQVFEGDDGLLAGLTTDKIWIDHSTTDYNQVKMNGE